MDSSRTRSFIMLNKILCRCKGCNPSTIHFRRQGQISPLSCSFACCFDGHHFAGSISSSRLFLLSRAPVIDQGNAVQGLDFCWACGLQQYYPKRKLQYKLENALSIEVDSQETFLSLQTTAILEPAHWKGSTGELRTILQFFQMAGIRYLCPVKSWMIVWCWGIQACKLLV